MVFRKLLAVANAIVLLAGFPLAGVSQQVPVAPSQQTPAQAPQAIRVATELVLVNVIARDKKGNLVRDLKREDFTVLEDGQKQQVSSFDFENIDELGLAGQTLPTVSGPEGAAVPSAAPSAK